MPLLLLIALLLLLAPPASAQAPGESSNPAIDQYRESLPTPQGPRYTGGRDREPPAQLPARVRDRLEREGGADAAALGALATSPALGAPERSAGDRDAPRDDRGRDGGGPGAPAGEPDRGIVSSALDAAAGGDSSGTLLMVLVGLVAAAGVGGAMTRRRSRAT